MGQGEGMGELNVIIRTGSRRTPETVFTVLIFSLTAFAGTGKAALTEYQDQHEMPSPQATGSGDEIPERSGDRYHTDLIQNLCV